MTDLRKMKERRSGRTTRLVDEAIQDLFHLGEAHVWDHYKEGKNIIANTYLANLVKGRLIMEHNIKATNIQLSKTSLGIIIKLIEVQCR